MNIFNRFKKRAKEEPVVKDLSNKGITEAVSQETDEVDYEDLVCFSEEEQEKDMKRQSHVGKTSGVINPRPRYLYNYKKIIDKKLSIILLENTEDSIAYKSNILKIIHKLNADDLVCVISYGSKVKVNRVCKVNEFEDEKLLDMDDIGNNRCFYDAINVLEMAVSISINKSVEIKSETFRIASIDVIGIGSGKAEGSKITREEAIELVSKIRLKNVETKYFCFTEETFAEPASLGFHSIGAFPTSK